MNSDLSETFEKIFFFLLIISFFTDIVLRATWNKGYFVVGVPIFIKRIPVNVKHKGVPFQYLLEEKFQTGMFTSLAFKQMGPFTYVFREKYFQNEVDCFLSFKFHEYFCCYNTVAWTLLHSSIFSVFKSMQFCS
jgi:hypothetical protein